MKLAVAVGILAVFYGIEQTESHNEVTGTCRMVFDDFSFHGPSTRTVAGAPGKKGPPGVKGEKGSTGSPGFKGEPATPCFCPERNALQNEIDDLKKQIKRVNAPEDCTEVIERKESYRGGVYTIYPHQSKERGETVYCDTKTDNGGWIVFQRRMDGSVNFYRNWNDYVKGFGDLNGEFWLGLDKIYNIMQTGRYELRIDLEDFENNTAYAKYSTFELGGPETFYAITTSGYSGTAGNALQLNAVPFSTKDQDHDIYPASCAQSFKGAMWYTSCHAANLNGLYLRGVVKSYANSVVWQPWKGHYYSLKFSEMKLRKKE